MGDRFDQLAKDAGGELSRRQAFWRIGGGLLAAAVASLGLTRASNNCARCCAICCRSETPPGDGTPGDCMRACLNGEGLCGGEFGQCSGACQQG